MGFNTASVWIKVALFCLVLSVVLFVIGFATISWMSNDGRDYHGYGWTDDWGLWRRKTCEYRRGCLSEKLNTRVLTFYGLEDSHRAVQAFESMGLICIAMALLIMLLFVFIDRMRKRSPLIAIIVFTFAAVVFMVIGFIVMATQFDSDDYRRRRGMISLSPHWSMWIAIVGCVLAFISGVMCVIDLNR